MKNATLSRNITAFILLVLLTTGLSSAQTVARYTGGPSPLPDRWKWAGEEARRQGFDRGYWIGYSIERMMGERSFTGSYHSDEWRNHPTLHELVTGIRLEDGPGGTGGITGKKAGNGPEKLVKKEVGILFHVPAGKPERTDDMRVSNLSLHVDLGGDPLVWMGGAEAGESVGFLVDLFSRAATGDTREQLLMAVGMHRETKEAMAFLKNVLRNSDDTELRGDAAFWIGQTETDDGRKVLMETVMKDPSEEVREKALFALTQMEGGKALDDLISVARTHDDRGTRKQAAFWLGQKASKKAIGALKDLTYNDRDTEVQRSAMFALTQIEDGSAVEELIKVAETHPNPKIRRDAIFWLGQTEDPRALEALVGMVKGK